MSEPANAYVLHTEADPGRLAQWLFSASAIVAVHVGLIAAALAWYQPAFAPGIEMPAIMVDMSPAPSAPTLQPQDLAPGPQMQEAHAMPEPAREPEPKLEPIPVPPEPLQQHALQEPAPEPVLPKPDVTMPPAAKQPPKQVTKPEAKKPEHAERAETRRKVEHAAHEPSRDKPAPRTTAAPKAERQASLQTSANAGRAAAAAALPSYRDRLAAHLARYKQYPSSAKAAGEQGTAMLSFTVGRGGQVLGSHLARSSGHPSLDAETMAMIRRAQPLPAFPPEMTQSSLSFTVPVNFSLR
ncbi:energy transducer TonB [Rhodopseudomonas sp. B29]|uniref:energy transducer TonB n=1 Tax=Rhodopseudomonas sp. B29 TaxID=95607 RepID=UPI0004CFCB15|nr:energy transducer TonB [Rhodopseudomonas sp. B29]